MLARILYLIDSLLPEIGRYRWEGRGGSRGGSSAGARSSGRGAQLNWSSGPGGRSRRFDSRLGSPRGSDWSRGSSRGSAAGTCGIIVSLLAIVWCIGGAPISYQLRAAWGSSGSVGTGGIRGIRGIRGIGGTRTVHFGEFHGMGWLILLDSRSLRSDSVHTDTGSR